MERETRYARPVILKNLLKKLGYKPEDEITWVYYGYGIQECAGTNKVKDIPIDVKCSKCFKTFDGVFHVDGAL